MKFLLLVVSLLTAISALADDSVIQRPVNQTYLGDNTVPVLPLLGVGPELTGRHIAYLIFRGHSANGKGQVVANVNGEDVGAPQAMGSASGTFTLRLPETANEISDDANQIALHLRGQVVVEAVGLKLLPGNAAPRPEPQPTPPAPPAPAPAPKPEPKPIPPPPTPPELPPAPPQDPGTPPQDPGLPPSNPQDPGLPPPGPAPELPGDPSHPGPGEPLVVTVRQYFTNGQSLPLYRFVDSDLFGSSRLVRVSFTGMSRYGTGRASFCDGHLCKTQKVGSEISRYTFDVRGKRPGEFSRIWRLQFAGDFWIENVELDFE